MKIFFEAYPYSVRTLKKYLSSHFYTETKDFKSGVISYVGYFFNINNDDPAKSDSVFILPKIFLDENNQPFGMEGIMPEDVIEIDLREFAGVQPIVFELSTWLYRAIARFYYRNQSTTITEESKIQNVVSSKGDNSTTQLDTILQLVAYHKDHHNLFTYISIVNTSGNNKIHWAKTIAKSQPIIRNNRPIYLDFQTKGKAINYDEEIIVLFYSVLEYLRAKYHFVIITDLRYNTLPPSTIERYIATGQGSRRLKEIRNKYFTDELVALWDLLYAFFDKAERVSNRKYHEETLLVRNFNIVFEDMIDQLIGTDRNKLPSGLLDQKDGKRVDHLFSGKSLMLSDPSSIYYIGDSKYYKPANETTSQSIYKQYTYAKNVIQFNIDNLLQGKSGDYRYRDKVTEGYNVTPNFFIRGAVDNEHRKYSYTKPDLEATGSEMQVHFIDRLFDRDTLIIQTYNINFLYVLSSYVNRGESKYKGYIRNKFKENFEQFLKERYSFSTLTPTQGLSVKDAIDKHFRILSGRVFCSKDEGLATLFLALEKPEQEMDENKRNLIIEENTAIQAAIADDFVCTPYTLGQNAHQISLEPMPHIIRMYSYDIEDNTIPMVAEDFNPDAYIANKTMLVGCYRDRQQLEWIKTKHLYNIRLGQRNGAVDKSGTIVSASRLLLYNPRNPQEYIVYRLDISKQIIASNQMMRDKEYPNLKPDSEYILYVVGDEITSAPCYDVAKLKEEFAPSLKKVAPFFVSY